MNKANSANRSINRICDILNCFSEEERYLTLTQISTQIDLPKSTTHRLLEALQSQGLLSYNNTKRCYELGYMLIRWGNLAQTGLDLRNVSLPFLRTLTDITEETSILSARYGNIGMCIEKIESNQPVRLAMSIGQRLALHSGASSKVLWAFLPADEIESILENIELHPLMENTIVTPDMLREELKKIRENGYATSFEETDRGAMGIAAPVYDHTGRPVAGIGIAAPISRIPREQVPDFASKVVDTAKKLSRHMGAVLN